MLIISVRVQVTSCRLAGLILGTELQVSLWNFLVLVFKTYVPELPIVVAFVVAFVIEVEVALVVAAGDVEALVVIAGGVDMTVKASEVVVTLAAVVFMADVVAEIMVDVVLVEVATADADDPQPVNTKIIVITMKIIVFHFRNPIFFI